MTSSSGPAGGPSDVAAWGRVAEDGTVYVRTRDGERVVGQWPGGDPSEVLAHFGRRYDALAAEVALLEQRVRGRKLSVDDARKSLDLVRASLSGARVVGDLAALEDRLGALGRLVEEQRVLRRVERARRQEEARTRKQAIAEEAERVAEGSDWRVGAERLRALLEEWKALPRLDKGADEPLWKRFSSARTTFTRRRKAHFAELNERREASRGVKEKLLAEAEAVAGSTDWGPTSGVYRDLMRRWKAAGPAPKDVEEDLWRRFRAAQDRFFAARDAALTATDAELAANAEKKEALLASAEALVPVTDVAAAKTTFRDLAVRWDAIGKVPRDRVKELEGRMRKVEQAIRGVEEETWRRSNPEARARAADTVAQLESSIADLEGRRDKALAAGDERAAADHATAVEVRRSWLEEARKALADFTP